ncbi:hypothetical protein NADFUDRAFT_48255 [Nadsonia fulvescens var. elongata DSM 6958]|uniref:C2H2-type domain-containing protein n=1 Tax=Nadsonia fulvescens var. elongata DSM 6958 TaxID=857566 RepID=A0A1E3PET5_9ASCO|nr:hypothetical protein NADFUDRAFT_48255 [Nadsonia fulvescens var. elongata DSM 6958]
MNSVDHQQPLLLPRPYSPPGSRPTSLLAYHYGPAGLPRPRPTLCQPSGVSAYYPPNYPSSYPSSYPPTYPYNVGYPPLDAAAPAPIYTGHTSHLHTPPPPPSALSSSSKYLQSPETKPPAALARINSEAPPSPPTSSSSISFSGSGISMLSNAAVSMVQYNHYRPISPPDSTASLSEGEVLAGHQLKIPRLSCSSNPGSGNIMSIASLVSETSDNSTIRSSPAKRKNDALDSSLSSSSDGHAKRTKWHRYDTQPAADQLSQNNRDDCQESDCQDADCQDDSHDHSGTKPHVCQDCQKGFLRLNDLIRHERSHKEVAQYYCPFYYDAYPNETNLTSAATDSVAKRQFCKCHQTGGFSRCDTFKNHLKSIHFVYPLGTKKKDRAGQSGVCKACDMKFENVNAWLVKHVENNQCRGIVKSLK